MKKHSYRKIRHCIVRVASYTFIDCRRICAHAIVTRTNGAPDKDCRAALPVKLAAVSRVSSFDTVRLCNDVLLHTATTPHSGQRLSGG